MTRPAIPNPCLCVVTDRARLPAGAGLVETVSAAVGGGANMVQLREKDALPRETLSLAYRLRDATRGRALLIINDRVDVAILSDADGVQLGENSIDVSSARRLLPDEALIGRSVHSVDGAIRARDEGADYLILGTIFPTASHPGGAVGGLALVERAARAVDIPILGIGGIDERSAAALTSAGASGAAAISAVISAPNPASAAARLTDALRPPRAAKTEDAIR